MNGAYAQLRPLMEKCGTPLAPDDFQRAVNLAFHRREAPVYDRIHRPMWESLPRVAERLVGQLLAARPDLPGGLIALDVGCGTGLGSSLLLKTKLGGHLARLDLLDTSAAMLRQCRRRARRWPVEKKWILGPLGEAETAAAYDLIFTCSVLHHLPDLEAFLRQISARQRRGGLFLHLQDPEGAAEDDAGHRARLEALQEDARLHPPRPRPLWRRAAGRLKRALCGTPSEDYLRHTNEDLLAAGVIRSPLTPQELWAITDIHVGPGRGLSPSRLQAGLPGYRLLGRCHYAFFGKLESELPPHFQEEERRLQAAGGSGGGQWAALWEKCE